MGMYNVIHVPCPRCENDVEFQSKSGSCELKHFSITNCPDEEIAGIAGDIETCDSCGFDVKISDGYEPRYNDFSHLVI
jgi:hypothetical protein